MILKVIAGSYDKQKLNSCSCLIECIKRTVKQEISLKYSAAFQLWKYFLDLYVLLFLYPTGNADWNSSGFHLKKIYTGID